MRGLDYLFSHCDGYGERRIGVDSFGVPVYTNRKGGIEDAVIVEVAPSATGTIQWHDAGEEQFSEQREQIHARRAILDFPQLSPVLCCHSY
jgi:hypothetical protein